MLATARLLLAVTAFAATSASAEIGFGADVVNRYVWRGADIGNAVSVQPAIAYATGPFEVGAWSSWAITGGGDNENDLYASYAVGPVVLLVTDYFLPKSAPGDFFNYGDGDEVHVLEATITAELGVADLLAAVNFSGDPDDSIWIEASVPLPALSTDDIEAGLTVGAGNGVYTTDTDPALVSISLNLWSGDYFAQYILNPDAEITFLVFGVGL